jgi:hypothetical protein
MTTHASCDHARTPKARQACRRARELGAQTPAKVSTIDVATRDRGGAIKTRNVRSGEAKRRLQHTLDVLSRAIDQSHPKRVLVTHAVPGLDVNTSTWGDAIEVAEHYLILLPENGFELALRYDQVKTIEL